MPVFRNKTSHYSTIVDCNGNYSFAFIGDVGKNTKKSEKLRTSIRQSGIKNLINAGDNLYSDVADFFGKASSHLKAKLHHNSYESVWNIWKQLGFNFFATAIGNHYKTISEEIEYFNLPGEFYSNIIPGVVRVIVLNSDNESSAIEQSFFLEKELAEATEPFLFVLYHHPPFTLVRIIHSSKNNFFHTPITPVLMKYKHKITALLLGHEHIALFANFFGIPCLINGAGQSTILWSPSLAHTNAKILWYDTGHPYWVHIHLNLITNTAAFRYMNADNHQTKCQFSIPLR